MAIDFLEPYPTRYSIEAEPAAQVVKRFNFGETKRRFVFSLLAVYEAVSDADRAGNARHYEDLSLWLEEQSRMRRLPAMGEDASPAAIRALGGVYVQDRAEDGGTCTYRMQLELLYHQKAR